ncbi:ComEC/Rec2 family competence protein [Streptomyces silvisoli]|uniref:ComEC/Rec2 family competence protein n=1 Tax=Streptomyces silvisoli TaxID=3034235 RepID=A0ABT5ZF45_9ACTN|nr:ComEC/Rec2 family competence protein [Streptomyces silvisoli]MDF3288235.1 ComEC/Rec2 family competence protein [Streptomyces silvisoli]
MNTPRSSASSAAPGRTVRAPRASAPPASAGGLGTSPPRQDGPADLRLVPPALATWLAAVIALNAPGRWVAVGAGVCLVAALALCVVHRTATGAMTGAPARRGVGTATVAAAALLCACAAAGVAGLGVAGLHRGPVPALAAQRTRVTAELTLTGDPRAVRPRVRGSTPAPPSVIAEADALRVTSRGTTTAVHTPVLLIVQPGDGAQAWLGLLPSTGLTLDGQLAPTTRQADRSAAVFQVHGPPTVTRPPSAVQRLAGALRAGLRDATDELPPDARALLPGFVVGDTSRVAPDLQEAFAETDLTHLLAVSGSNLTVILTLLIGPSSLAVRAERRGIAARLGLPLRLTAVLGGVLTIGFVVLCRPDPSVLRAAVCGLITLLAIGTGRRRTLLPALAAAVIALVLYDPWLARSYGFALSVLATAGLLTLAPGWSAALRRRGVPAHLAEALAAAAAAQVLCAPLVAVLAAHISLVAIPCNLLAELAVPPATVLGFAALAAAPVSMLAAKCLAWLAGWPVVWVAMVAREGAALPGAALDWPGGWTGGLLLAAVTAVLLSLARRIARHPWFCAALAALLLVAVLAPAPLTRLATGWPPAGWRMAACDVGQGDALVLNSGDGDGSAVVVDTGPEPMLADRCLKSLGVTTIPLLILTHFHADHVAGLPGVLAGRSVGAIETTTVDAPPGEAASVRRRAAASHIPVLRATEGERRQLGQLDWQILWPPEPEAALPDADPNDSSVTLLVRTAGLTLILLGDLEPPAQRELLARHPDLPPVDVLKVAHHGSSHQDPALLARLHPRLALISCGMGNKYGHPSPRTLNTLHTEGTTVLRTDTDGPIAITGGNGAGLGASLVKEPL